MPFGATVQLDGSVLFRTFAPDVPSLGLAIEGRAEPLAFKALGDGWHELQTSEAAAGTLYRLVLPDGRRVPDPASRFQPRDVNGPSEVIAPGSYVWSDGSWKGRPWTEAVMYELHVGAFTPEGTFAAAMEKLDHLRDLGVTVIEVMPVADFPGRWNWGYDGVLLYAPDSSYGRPEDFKAFVEAAHERGISVVLDVVYNHFGPEGNYIPEYFKQLFTEHHKTGWGNAVNYDNGGSEHVREFVVHNALYWVEEFHLDGLRFDAVHAIIDESPRHILDEIAETLREKITDRPLHLILENERNEACRLRRGPDGKPVHYTAQWNDDMHHVLHTAATNEQHGYYKDYAGDTELLGRAIAEGFAFQGEVMEFSGKPRGQRCADVPTHCVHCVHPEPRPDRQSRVRRASAAPGRASSEARAGVGLSADAADTDAVHGRGVERFTTVSRTSATSTVSLRTRSAKAAARSSARFRSSRTRRSSGRFPIQVARRRSARPSWTGLRRKLARGQSGWTSIAACSTFAANGFFRWFRTSNRRRAGSRSWVAERCTLNGSSRTDGCWSVLRICALIRSLTKLTWMARRSGGKDLRARGTSWVRGRFAGR